ncbi:hypothetical protein BX666DRAFT_2024277 [Dichotomocladium elegans]|nr:hypothetical protein BX666DRAFT_2024277 [Dichotomocladium elegans]
MEKSFASLLRNSRLASYDRKLPQVYKASQPNRQKGNWGLKRNLPTVIRTPFVTVSDLDTAEHQTPWRSGTSQVMFVRRWKENFPNSKRPAPRPDTIEHNVALMTPAEFKQYARTVARKSQLPFQQQLKNQTIKPEQVYEYLGATFNETKSGSVVGPTYSDHAVETSHPVEGRFLNNDRQGYAVGVGGVVALCLSRHLSSTRLLGDRRQRVFYVEEASIDPQGRPHVIVSPYKPGSSSISAILGDEEEGAAAGRGSRMKAEDMFDTSHKKSARRSSETPDKSDNIQENPKHKELMSYLDIFIDKADKD